MFLIHPNKHKQKPSLNQVALVQKTWDKAIKTNDINLLKKSLELGQTIKFNFEKLDTLIVDADNVKKDLSNVLNILEKNNLLPTLAYNSFSANKTKNNFRLIYFFNNENNLLSKDAYLNFTVKLENILDIDLDYAFANNSKQLCYGTNKYVYEFKQNEIELDHSLNYKNNIKNRFISNALKFDKNANVLVLESLNYIDFKKELNKLLETKTHIGYDVCLRWFFASNFNEIQRNQILSLASNENQYKVLKIYETKDKNYALRLFNPNGNFWKLYKENKEKQFMQKIDKELNTEKPEFLVKRDEFWKNVNVELFKSKTNEELYEIYKNEFPKKSMEQDTKYDWLSFKKGLLENCGIEYVSKDKQKMDYELNTKQDIFKNAENKLTLIAVGKITPDGESRFAILDKNQNPLMYGKEFDYKYDNSFQGDLSACKKAIWIADEIKKSKGIDNLVLEIKTPSSALSYQYKQDQKGYILTTKSIEKNIGLVVTPIDLTKQKDFFEKANNLVIERNDFKKFDKSADYTNILDINNFKNIDFKKIINDNRKENSNEIVKEQQKENEMVKEQKEM